MELSATLDFSDVDRGFKGMINRSKRGQIFFRELNPSARKDLKEHRKQRRGPQGTWAPRSAETRKRAKRKSKKKRRKSRTGNLLGGVPASYKAFFSSDHLRLLNRVKFADALNSGATTGNGARLPARTFGYWSADFADSAQRQYVAFVVKGYLRTT